jgi:hypothetical protein
MRIRCNYRRELQFLPALIPIHDNSVSADSCGDACSSTQDCLQQIVVHSQNHWDAASLADGLHGFFKHLAPGECCPLHSVSKSALLQVVPAHDCDRNAPMHIGLDTYRGMHDKSSFTSRDFLGCSSKSRGPRRGGHWRDACIVVNLLQNASCTTGSLKFPLHSLH